MQIQQKAISDLYKKEYLISVFILNFTKIWTFILKVIQLLINNLLFSFVFSSAMMIEFFIEHYLFKKSSWAVHFWKAVQIKSDPKKLIFSPSRSTISAVSWLILQLLKAKRHLWSSTLHASEATPNLTTIRWSKCIINLVLRD